jgi:hypothetical protein
LPRNFFREERRGYMGDPDINRKPLVHTPTLSFLIHPKPPSWKARSKILKKQGNFAERYGVPSRKYFYSARKAQMTMPRYSARNAQKCPLFRERATKKRSNVFLMKDSFIFTLSLTFATLYFSEKKKGKEKGEESKTGRRHRWPSVVLVPRRSCCPRPAARPVLLRWVL